MPAVTQCKFCKILEPGYLKHLSQATGPELKRPTVQPPYICRLSKRNSLSHQTLNPPTPVPFCSVLEEALGFN